MKIQILGRKEDLTKMKSTLKVLQRSIMVLGIPADITLTHDFKAFTGSAFNPSMTPVIFINGMVEYAGSIPDQKLLNLKLQQLRSGAAGGDLF